MHVSFKDIVEFALIGLVVGGMVAMLAWADAREHELGISGMSSERILVQDELPGR